MKVLGQNLRTTSSGDALGGQLGYAVVVFHEAALEVRGAECRVPLPTPKLQVLQPEAQLPEPKRAPHDGRTGRKEQPG